jgi:anti-sigma factor RsiW
MDCEEAQELITAWVDNELSAGERVTVEAHLRHCAACRLEFERESVLKRRVRLAGLQITAPAELHRMVEEKSLAATAVKKTWHGWSLRGRWALLSWRLIEEKTAALALAKKTWSDWSFRTRFPKSHGTRIKEKNAALAYVKRAWNGWSLRAWLALPTWRRALISAMLVSIVALVIFTRGHDESESGFATEAFEVHAAILSGKTTLLRAVNLAAMRKELASAVGERFKPVVLDLSMMKLHPVAGFVRNIRGRDMLVTVYEGDGPVITCFTFLGGDADAPQGAERFFDSKMKVNYYSFSHDDLNAVLHQEGDVMCLLVSKMAPAELLALLRGKSAHG